MRTQPGNSSIEVLPQAVVEKIAAGEVVERPSSVLKELLENAIDAGASHIDIEVETSGFSLIRISDNGTGMSCRDLGKCLLPHATSKIKSAEDLFSIATMGFRGEALASISAVSRLTIASSSEESGLGYVLSSDGGVHGEIHPDRHLRGTTVTVRDLFFNVPARKKFMKSNRGEHLAIVRMLEQIVIPFNDIHFTATIDGKRILDLPKADTPISRIAAVAGPEFAKQLLFCRGVREGMDVQVYVSTPEQLQQRPRFQSLFVNLRRIDNDSVTFAIREAFSQFLGSGNRPNFFCFLDIDPSRIDVNVHPTKQQIKFDDERGLFGFVFSSVKQSILSQVTSGNDLIQPPRLPDSPTSLPPRVSSSAVNTEPAHYGSPPSFPVPKWLDRASAHAAAKSGSYPESFPAAGIAPPFAAAGDQSSFQTILPFPVPVHEDHEKGIDSAKDIAVQLPGDDSDQNWDLISCYQIHGIFVLAPIKNGILLLDQHAAHERILYEQALEDIVRGRSASQQLLFPIVVELSLTEKNIVESSRTWFEAFGFDIADFGGNALSISAIPAFLKDAQVDATIREIVRYLLEGRSPGTMLEPEKRFAAAFACGAAIKAGQKLSQEEMNALLNSLFSTNNPYTCPHGRPTLVRISLDELARRFLR